MAHLEKFSLIFNFVYLSPFQSLSFKAVLVSAQFIVISLVFFYLRKLSF